MPTTSPDKTRDSSGDFDTLEAANNGIPSGIWSNGNTMWVADPGDDKIYAYRMADKQRDASKDFDTLSAAGNHNTAGIWSDGATMWVADPDDDKLYAYRMSDKTRDASKDFNTLDAENVFAYGIWSGQHHHVGGREGQRKALCLPYVQQDARRQQGLQHAGLQREMLNQPASHRTASPWVDSGLQ